MPTDNKNKILNVPNLRFPEFGGEWTRCTIGDYGNVITGSTPSTNDVENYDNGTYLWASPADLGGTKYIELTQTRLTDKGFAKTRSFPGNSILVTCIGSTIGKMGMSKIAMSTNQQINTIVPTGHDANFVYYALQSRFPRYLSSIAVQAVPIISKSAFEKLENHTTQIDEQNKIGSFLSLLDERINTQNKIIEDLKKLKVAISYRLLNNNALLYKTASLSKFGELKNGYAFKSSTYAPNGNYNIITIANVSGSREISADGSNTISSIPKDIQSHQILKSGDILISLTGNVGRVSLNKGNNNLLNQRVGLFVPNNSISSEFLYQTLSFVQFENSMINLAQGAAQMNIGKSDVESYQVRYSDNQQLINKISQILLDYDKKIEIENKYLQSLLSQKNYLLSNMFI